MNGNKLLFYVAKSKGFEFVFTSGHALTYPTHTHVSVFTITIVRRGSVFLQKGTKKLLFPSGSMYILAPHEPHAPTYSDAFDIVSLCINKELFLAIGFAEITNDILEYTAEFYENKLLSPFDIQLILQGVDEIFFNYKNLFQWDNAASMHILSGVAEYDNVFKHIREFKKNMGLTPHQYIIQCRIRDAKKMLTNSLSIADVAAETGFYDQSHLNRWFNKSIGITPQEYKKMCFML